QDAAVVMVGGGGKGGQGGGFVCAGVDLEWLNGVRAAGEGGDGLAVTFVEAGHGLIGRVVEGGRAGGAGCGEEGDFCAQLGYVGGQIVAVSGVLGEGARSHGFGAGQLVVEVACEPARVVEGLGVGAQRSRAAGVDVVFGDDVVDAAGGVDEFGAGAVKAGPGGVHDGVDALGLFGDR